MEFNIHNGQDDKDDGLDNYNTSSHVTIKETHDFGMNKRLSKIEQIDEELTPPEQDEAKPSDSITRPKMINDGKNVVNILYNNINNKSMDSKTQNTIITNESQEKSLSDLENEINQLSQQNSMSIKN